MMAKRGDDVGKALAGSLMAAHDEDISLVGNTITNPLERHLT